MGDRVIWSALKEGEYRRLRPQEQWGGGSRGVYWSQNRSTVGGNGVSDPLWIQVWCHRVSGLRLMRTFPSHSTTPKPHGGGVRGCGSWHANGDNRTEGGAQGLSTHGRQASASQPPGPYLGGPSFENWNP